MFADMLILALLWKWGASVGWLACKVQKTGMDAEKSAAMVHRLVRPGRDPVQLKVTSVQTVSRDEVKIV